MSDVLDHDGEHVPLEEIAHEELAVHLDSLEDAMAFFKSRNNHTTQDSDAGRVLEHVAMRAVYFRQLGMIDDEYATRLINAVNKNQVYLHTEYESASDRQNVYKRAMFETLDYSVLDSAASSSDVSQAPSSMGAAPAKETATTGVNAFEGIDHRHIFREPPRRQTRKQLTQEHVNALGLFLYHSEIAPNIVMAVLTALTISTYGVAPALVAKGMAMVAAGLLPGRRQPQPDESADERLVRRRRTAVAGTVGVFGQAAAGVVGQTLHLRNAAETRGWMMSIAVSMGVEDPNRFMQMPLQIFGDGELGQLANKVLSTGNQVVFNLTNLVADNSGWITIGSIVASLAYYFMAFHERMYLPERMNHFLRLNDRNDARAWKNEFDVRLDAIVTQWKQGDVTLLRKRNRLLYDARNHATQGVTLEREVQVVSDFVRDMRSLKLRIEQLRRQGAGANDPHPPGFRASVVDEVFERMQTMRLP